VLSPIGMVLALLPAPARTARRAFVPWVRLAASPCADRGRALPLLDPGGHGGNRCCAPFRCGARSDESAARRPVVREALAVGGPPPSDRRSGVAALGAVAPAAGVV